VLSSLQFDFIAQCDPQQAANKGGFFIGVLMTFSAPRDQQFAAFLRDKILSDPAFQTALNGAMVDALGTVLTTRGDVLRKGASNAERLALGAANSILSSDGTDVKYQTVATLLESLIGSTRGAIPYRGGSAWTGLSPGTSGQFLKTQGANADPIWADVVSTGRLIAGTPLVLNPVSTSSTSSQAHGLGVVPVYIDFEMECLTADFSYSVGDIVRMGGVTLNLTISSDATNVTLVTGTSGLTVHHKSSNTAGTITASRWKITLTPYKLS
jgi:hypothetical protein